MAEQRIDSGQGQQLLAISPDLDAEVSHLARQARAASGPVMKAINGLGRRAETGFAAFLPEPVQAALQSATAAALGRAYHLARRGRQAGRRLPDLGGWSQRLAVMASGGAGGFAGLPGAIAELPVSVSLMFAAIQKVAERHGFDPESERIQMECLQVFGSGTLMPGDDGVDSGFIGSRVALTGASVHALIARIAPQVAAVLGQKLAAQAVPVLGAVTGAGVNLAFIRYYEDLAGVHFRLLRLAEDNPDQDVMAAFRALAAGPLKTVAR